MNKTRIAAEPVARLRDAQFAACDQCDMTHEQCDPYWGVNKFKWMHERGTGHRVRYYRYQRIPQSQP